MSYTKKLVRKYLTEHTLKKLLNENMTSIDDWHEYRDELQRDIFGMIKNRKPIRFNLIPKNQYHKALQEFVTYKDFVRFPTKFIFDWKQLLLVNIVKLEVLTDIAGHTNDFPFDEFYDVFDYNHDTGEDRDGEFKQWCQMKYKETGNNDYIRSYDWGSAYEFLDEVYNMDDVLPLFSNGQWVLSDFGLAPLFELGQVLVDQEDPRQIIVTINKILDVSHQRSDLAELFIEGGSASLEHISNS